VTEASEVVAPPAAYPATRSARDRFVLERRGPRRVVDPWQPPRVVIEPEPDGAGGVVDVTTIFLTGRECPWRCAMCDLWRETTEADTPEGAIPHQIRVALSSTTPESFPIDSGVERERLRSGGIKLYNAGSFFDPRAVPIADHEAIARAVDPFARAIVESHPRLVGDATWRFRDRLAADTRLEVAMGLETAHPAALARLNKGCSLGDFAAAADALAAHGVALRAFVLVHPPFVPAGEQPAWLARSIDAAIDAGATTIALIPTRGGNGAMEALAALGAFAPPALADLEASAAASLRQAAGRARVLADLWDLAAFSPCGGCLDARRARLLRLNLEQRVPAAIACDACGAVTPA
jgi:archaeosine synthase beta-subunit